MDKANQPNINQASVARGDELLKTILPDLQEDFVKMQSAQAAIMQRVDTALKVQGESPENWQFSIYDLKLFQVDPPADDTEQPGEAKTIVDAPPVVGKAPKDNNTDKV